MDGLKVLVNTIVSPKEAFEALRERPTWVWAMVIAIILGAVGSMLTAPAISHAMLANPAAVIGPQAATMTPEQVQNAAQIGAKFASFGWIFVIIIVPISLAFSALIMLLFDKMGRGDGTFARYWAVQANIAVVIALGQVVLAIIVMARGIDSFNSLHDVLSAIPSLGWIVPTSNAKLAAFFAYMSPFILWAAGLTGYSMIVAGRVPKMQAWLAALVMLIGGALLTAAGAK